MKAKVLLFGLLSSCVATPAPSATPAARAKPPAEDAARIVEAAASELERSYVFADKGHEFAEYLRGRQREGTYAGEETSALARHLTEDLRAKSHDGHLWIKYSEKPLPDEDERSKADMEKRDIEKYFGPRVNYGVTKVEHLPDNVGVLELSAFAPLDVGAHAASAAMTLLATSDALVIDLRNNGGGDGEMVAFLAAYLFDKGPQTMSSTYWRAENKTLPGLTPAYVPGRRFGSTKPVYVLTSKRTFSAAENFAYDLQALKRVVVVGERSGGGAHPNAMKKLTPHFAMSVAIGRSLNPITNADWEGTGVTPDVPVPAEQALVKALELARAAKPR